MNVSHVCVRTIENSSPFRFRIRQVYKKSILRMPKVRNIPAYNCDSLQQYGEGKLQQALA